MRIAIIASLTLTTALASGADPGWVKQSQDDGITIYAREKKGTDIKELKAIKVVKAPAYACMNVVSDLGRFKEMMPYTKESKVVGTAGPRAVYSYQYLSLPLISDRDYTLKVRDETPESKQGPPPAYYKSSWVEANDKGPKPRSGVERVKVNKGYWLFEPIEGGVRTRITYYVFTDPGGMVPSFMANRANTQAIPNLFAAVVKNSTLPRYQNKPYARPGQP